MATDLREDQKMSDDEVLAQITTFVSDTICPLVSNGTDHVDAGR